MREKRNMNGIRKLTEKCGNMCSGKCVENYLKNNNTTQFICKHIET